MITGLICGTCQKVVPASGEHWLNECPEPDIHPGMVQAALDSDGSKFHVEMICTPTTVLGKIREECIKRTLPTWPRAQGLNSMGCGSAVGEWIEPPMLRGGWLRQVSGRGELFGVPFKTRADLVLPDRKAGVLHVIQNKFGGAGEFWYTNTGHLAKIEVSAQVNMEFEILTQMEEFKGLGRGELLAWTGTIAKAAFDKKSGQFTQTWVKQRVKPMTLDEIGEVKPAGSRTSVRENVAIFTQFAAEIAAGVPAVEALKKVPMSCEAMYGGACKVYCGSNLTCLRLAGIRPASRGIVEVEVPFAEAGI